MIYCLYDKLKYDNFTTDVSEIKVIDYMEYSNDVNAIADKSNQILIKGMINSDDFLRIILKYHNSKKNFLSHIFILNKNKKTFIVSDAVLNQFPTIEQRLVIAKNAINFCKSHGIFDKICVSFLNHSSHFNIKNKTANESYLLKMALEKEYSDIDVITGQLDVALSKKSRKIKGIKGKSANIVIANDINEGNSIVKSFMLNGWKCYGYLLGADVDIILNSRSELNIKESLNYLLEKKAQ